MNKSKFKINVKRRYSSSVAIISLLFSLLSTIRLLYLGSYFWVISGLCSMLAVLSVWLGIDYLLAISGFNSNYLRWTRAIKSVLMFAYFISCTYGLYITIIFIPTNDFSILFIPSIIISLLLLSASIGIFDGQKND